MSSTRHKKKKSNEVNFVTCRTRTENNTSNTNTNTDKQQQQNHRPDERRLPCADVVDRVLDNNVPALNQRHVGDVLFVVVGERRVSECSIDNDISKMAVTPCVIPSVCV